ncbi:MAG: NIPSNAP family protein [Planctomycetia bacterium]|nr:NIPSNAP family protein [Planctomycetia bacterium]
MPSDAAKPNRPLTVLAVVAAFALGTVVAILITRPAAAEDKPAAERFFEMRTYVAHDGKFADLHKRFREHTNRLFQKHGMTLIGYWTPASGPEAENTLVYILAYPSREAREKSWKDFMADPEWQSVRKESEKNGPLLAKPPVSQFLKPTDYSPIK